MEDIRRVHAGILEPIAFSSYIIDGALEPIDNLLFHQQ